MVSMLDSWETDSIVDPIIAGALLEIVREDPPNSRGYGCSGILFDDFAETIWVAHPGMVWMMVLTGVPCGLSDLKDISKTGHRLRPSKLRALKSGSPMLGVDDEAKYPSLSERMAGYTLVTCPTDVRSICADSVAPLQFIRSLDHSARVRLQPIKKRCLITATLVTASLAYNILGESRPIHATALLT